MFLAKIELEGLTNQTKTTSSPSLRIEVCFTVILLAQLKEQKKLNESSQVASRLKERMLCVRKIVQATRYRSWKRRDSS